MKLQTKWVLMAVASGFMAFNSVQAQYVTGQANLSNIDPTAPSYSGGWSAAGSSDTATGFQITANPGTNANVFSTMYYALTPGQMTTLNTADTQVTFTWTWNSGTAAGGINVLFALDDNNGGVDYYDAVNPSYSITPVSGTTYTSTIDLMSPNLANIAAGTNIGGINLQMDPANVAGAYSWTVDSIELTPAPEPTTLALGGLCAAGFLVFRRRNRK